MIKSLWRKRFVRILTYVLASVVSFNSLVWLASPALSRAVLTGLLEGGRIELDAESEVRLNLFRSRFSVNNLGWRGPQGQRFELKHFELDYHLWSLFARELEITRVRVDGINVGFVRDETQFGFAGFDLSAASEVEQEVEALVEGQEEGVEGLELLPLAVHIPEIEITNLHLQAQDHEHTHHFIVQSLKLQRGFANKEIVRSHLTLESLLNDVPIELDTEVNWQADGGMLKASLQVNGFDLAPYTYLLEGLDLELGFDLNVNLQLNLPPSGQLVRTADQINIESFNVSVKDVGVIHAQQSVALEQFELSIEKAILDKKAESYDLNIPVQISIESLIVGKPEQADVLVSLDKLGFEQAYIKGDTNTPLFSAAKFILQGVAYSAPEKHDTFFTLADLNVLGIEGDATELFIQQVQIGAIELNALKDEQGAWLNLMLPESTSAEVEAEGEEQVAAEKEAVSPVVTEEKAEEETESFALRIAEVELQAPAMLFLHDPSTTPTFELRLQVDKFTASNIDNTDVEQVSDIHMEMSDGKYFHQNADVSWQLFHPSPSGKLNVKLTQFPLYKISPILEHQLGFDVLAGELDLDFNGTVDKAMLDSKAKVLLRGAEFSSGDDSQDDGEIVGQAAVPLNMALNMLKDSKGNIKLTVPVDGNINDPNFSLRDVFLLVAKRAAMSQAKKEIIKTLIPYGQMVSIAMSAGSYALKVRFADLVFEPGSVQLNEDSAIKQGQLLLLLQDKPKLDLRVCPVASLADVQPAYTGELSKAQHTELMALAQRRAHGLKDFLVAQGIQPQRLLLCSPRLDKDKDALGRIEFED